MAARTLAIIASLVMTSWVAFATDPNQLQDFCVATTDPNNALFVNGLFCKNPATVTPEDFFFPGFNVPGNTNNKLGSNVTIVNVNELPGLNTLGIAFARVDLAVGGVNPPHLHPRATELLTVLEGTIYVGFVTSNKQNGGPNQLFSKVLNVGDVYVVPQGLIHFEFNVGKTPAATINAFSSQNQGVITIANSVFGSQPPISTDVLTKAFQLDKSVIQYLQSQFWMDNDKY